MTYLHDRLPTQDVCHQRLQPRNLSANLVQSSEAGSSHALVAAASDQRPALRGSVARSRRLERHCAAHRRAFGPQGWQAMCLSYKALQGPAAPSAAASVRCEGHPLECRHCRQLAGLWLRCAAVSYVLTVRLPAWIPASCV